MKRGILVAIGLLTTAAVAGAAYYVTPVHKTRVDVPPAWVEGKPEQVLKTIRSATFRQFLLQGGGRDEPSGRVQLRHGLGSADEANATLWVGNDKVLEIRVKVRPFGTEPGNETSVMDVSTALPPSRLTGQSVLHPYDAVAMAGVSDFIVTDYLASILNQRRFVNTGEMRRHALDQLGFDEAQYSGFAERVGLAAQAAYRLGDRPGSGFDEDDGPDAARAWNPEPEEDEDLGADSAKVYADELEAREKEERLARRVTDGD